MAGQVGARQHFWFGLTDDMLDLRGGTLEIPAELAKNGREHRVYLTDVEVPLLREQLMARPAGTPLVFPNPRGEKWDRSRFREQVWSKAVEAAARHDREASGRATSVFDGFTFHLLRHTAGSLMAVSGFDPAAASERLGQTDGGALFQKTYRHLYENERRANADRFASFVRESLDEDGTSGSDEDEKPLDQAVAADGRTWDRTALQSGHFLSVGWHRGGTVRTRPCEVGVPEAHRARLTGSSNLPVRPPPR